MNPTQTSTARLIHTLLSLQPSRALVSSVVFLLFIGTSLSAAEQAHSNLKSAFNSKAPYAYLDWLPREQFQFIDDPTLDDVPSYCSGAFYAPQPATPGARGLVVAEADNADHNPGSTSTLSGSVQVTQDNRSFHSETIHFDHQLNQASMPGKTQFREPGLLILGNDAEIDLGKNRIEIKSAQYVLHEQHVHGSAEHLQKDNDITLIDNGVYTSCPPAKNPIWQLRSQQMRLNQTTGWGTAKNVRVEIYRVPLLYIPYFKFPIDDRRQSGFLFPNIALSNLGGVDITVPYYFNIAPNYDLTYSPRYIRRRGALHQGEFRYLNQLGEGQIVLAQLSSDQQVADQRETLNTSANTDTEAAVNADSSRRFAALRHEGQYRSNWTSRINAQYASDEDYFQDLGSDFSINNRTHLQRQADLIYSGEHWDFSGSLQGFQTLDEDLTDTSKPYFQLPLLKLTTLQTPREWLALGLHSEYVYFDRNADDSVLVNPTGHRLQIQPSISFPYQPMWGFITPTLKIKHLQYHINGMNEEVTDTPSVTVPVFNLDSGLYFERDLTWGNDRYLQTLDPRLFVLHAPYRNQDNLPDFDTASLTHSYNQLFRDRRFSGGDRIGDHDQVSLGISSSLFDATTGEEQLQLLLGQSFFLKDRQVSLIEGEIDSQEQSPISGELRLNAIKDWQLSGSFSWDADHNINQANTLSATYLPGNGRLLQLALYSREQTQGLDFDGRERSRQSKLSFAMPLKPQWSLLGHWNYNLKEQDTLDGNTTLESYLGVEYENCCLQARLINHRFLRQTDNELKPSQQIMLQLQLKGLANFDDNVLSIIERTIPGYNERFGSSSSNIH